MPASSWHLLQWLPWGLTLIMVYLMLSTSMRSTREVRQPAMHAQLPADWCSYGSLPGYWSTEGPAAPGTHWRVLDPRCQLENLLLLYTPPTHASTARAAHALHGSLSMVAGSESKVEMAPGQTRLRLPRSLAAASDTPSALTASPEASPSATEGQQGQQEQPSLTHTGAASHPVMRSTPRATSTAFLAASEQPRPQEGEPGHTEPNAEAPKAAMSGMDQEPDIGPGIMFLSDSVDKHVLTHLCELAGGEVVFFNPDGTLFGSASASRTPTTASTNSSEAGAGAQTTGWGGVGAGERGAVPHPANKYLAHVCTLPEPQQSRQPQPQPQQQLQQQQQQQQAPSSRGGGPPRLRLLSTYFPGVHPTGPYHKGVRAGWGHQLEDAARVWDAAPQTRGAPPDIVVVASTLWDLARMAVHEPRTLAGPELPRGVVDAWVANASVVVEGVRRAVPGAGMLATHTTMPPRFNVTTGAMDRGYLGKRFFVTQLNVAARQLAHASRLEVVDYAAMASRFFEGQAYLGDGLHPSKGVALELANVWLNLVHQVRDKRRSKAREGGKWCHPSMPCHASPSSPPSP